MRKIFLITLIYLFFVFFPTSVSAQVVINEFSSNSDTEWVELYNTTLNSIDLTGWKIQDGAQPPELLSGTIQPQAYFVFEHNSGWLNNSGSDSITLKDLSDTAIDGVTYGSGGVVGIPAPDKSAGRVPNSSTTWQNNLSWTKGYVNPDPTPSPSPTTTATSTSVPTQSPTPTPTPTKSPTPSPTKSPTPKASNSPSPSPEVLGEETSPTNDPKTQEVSPTPLVLDSAKKKFPFIPVLFIGSGLAMIVFAAVQLMNAKKSAQET